MTKNPFIPADDPYTQTTIASESNGIWGIEIFDKGRQVIFGCESDHAPLSGRTMYAYVHDGRLTAGEDFYLVPAYVVARAQRMVTENLPRAVTVTP